MKCAAPYRIEITSGKTSCYNSRVVNMAVWRSSTGDVADSDMVEPN